MICLDGMDNTKNKSKFVSDGFQPKKIISKFVYYAKALKKH